MSARRIDDAIMIDWKRVSSRLEQLSLPLWLELGLTMPQLKALVVVANNEGIAVTKLGCELGIGQPSASLLVDQLVKRGYVERAEDPTDRRRVLLGTTQQGGDLVSELRHGRRQAMAEWLRRLSDEDADALARGLSALADIAWQDTQRNE